MSSYLSACEAAFIEFSKYENARVLNSEEKREKWYGIDLIVWEVKSGVSINDKFLPLTFYIIFFADFPFSLPRIYLDQKSFDAVKYIPHIDADKFVCTFDT